MVKNQQGGCRAKSFARKNENIGKQTSRLRLAELDGEIYACVTKLHGNTCAVTTINGVRLVGHIRSKFSGRNKRGNIIGTNTIVLVGLREWESTQKNCDILEVYSANEVEQLKTIPKVQFERLYPYITNTDNTSAANDQDSAFDFGYSAAANTLLEENGKEKSVEEYKVDAFDLQESAEINIDEI
jgi:translation initiation factor IF-1